VEQREKIDTHLFCYIKVETHKRVPWCHTRTAQVGINRRSIDVRQQFVVLNSQHCFAASLFIHAILLLISGRESDAPPISVADLRSSLFNKPRHITWIDIKLSKIKYERHFFQLSIITHIYSFKLYFSDYKELFFSFYMYF
jgi:hypothetical protein